MLTGGAGDDLLIGDAGNDLLRQAQGVDWAFGGGGNDTFLVTDTGGTSTSPEADILDGDAGSDMLRVATANSGPVQLFGASISGIETLRDRGRLSLADTAQFAGFTRIELATGTGSTTTLGIKGHGTVNLNLPDMPQSSAAGLFVMLASDGTPGTVFTLEGRDLGTFVNDSVLGSLGNDSIRGNGGNDTLRASDGNDTLLGGSGNDSLLGNNGNDTIFAGNGADTLEGGAASTRCRAAPRRTASASPPRTC